ncbi:MAG: non-heme iron oxygenase ferredoxin subunit [Gammaproteobacteria bacterium]|nr:non-heme iron oxygenase ferredoxin subunit [Gammaproteobacteria bacterium]MDH3465908.1 non-heme iron oxygenase ferredoxin subunit [Gammaproteobacteria bacterium]
MTSYTRIAGLADIPVGKMLRVDHAPEPILLVNVDAHIYALCDTCPHEDASLASGALQGKFVKCPLHGSRFDVRDGTVQEEPAEHGLTVFDVRIEGNDILLGPPRS